jgi:hypothetical protein
VLQLFDLTRQVEVVKNLPDGGIEAVAADFVAREGLSVDDGDTEAGAGGKSGAAGAGGAGADNN